MLQRQQGHSQLLKAVRKHTNVDSSPLTLAVMMMVAHQGNEGLMSSQLAWASAPLLQVHTLHFATPTCEVGDKARFAPRMSTPAATYWLQSRGATWWCAQRGHLTGVRLLLRTVPGADFYLLLDADTQVFPQAMHVLLELLQAHFLAPDADLYAGHLLHPAFLAYHSSTIVRFKPKPFIGTGGGALIRGLTLRRLNVTGTLDRFIQQQTSGALRWLPLDQTLGLAMATINVPPLGHAAFQQFAGDDKVGTCNATWAACHEYGKGCQPHKLGHAQLRDMWETPERGLSPRCDGKTGIDVNVAAHEHAFRRKVLKQHIDLLQWAAPCEVNDFGMANYWDPSTATAMTWEEMNKLVGTHGPGLWASSPYVSKCSKENQ